MKISCLLLFFLWSNLLWGQMPMRTAWIETIPGSQFEENNALAQAPCGDLYTVGFFQDTFGVLTSYGIGNEDGFITKYSEQGQLMWVRQLRGSSTDRINGIHISGDNELYIVGEFRDTLFCGNDTLLSQGRLDIFVAKVDSNGAFQWAFSAGDIEDDSAHDIDALPDGTLVLTGYYEARLPWGNNSLTSSRGRDVFVATVSPQGVVEWASPLSGPSSDECNSVATDDYGNIYIAGAFRDILYVNGNTVRAEGDMDAFIAQYNRAGVIQWVKPMGGPSNDQGRYVQVDGEQNIVVAGWVSQYLALNFNTYFGSQEEDVFAVKFDSNGNSLWVKVLGNTFDERVYGLDFDQHNNVYLMGTLDSLLVINQDSLRNRHLNRPTDIFILKYDADGNYKWGQTLGHYYNDFCYDLMVPNSRTLYLAGSYQDTSIFITDTLVSDYGYDIFLAEFTLDTSLSVRRIINDPALLMASLFPNPSLEHTTLSYSLEQAGLVTLSLYNVAGQALWQRHLGRQNAGAQTCTVERAQLPAGLYYLHLEADNRHRVLPLIWR